MKLGDIFLTASANMFRSKLRTLLTILAIFVGAFTLTITNGIGAGVSNYIDRQVDNLGSKDLISITVKSSETTATSSDQPTKYDPSKQTAAANATPGPAASSGGALVEKDIEALRTIPEIKDVQPVYSVAPDYISAGTSDKYKVSSSAVGGIATLDLAAGSQLDKNSDVNQVVLPLKYISALGFSSNEDAIGKTVTIGITSAFGKQSVVDATIVGVLQKGIVSSSGAAFNSALTKNLYAIQTDGLPDAAKNKYALATATIVDTSTADKVTDAKNKLDALGYAGQTTEDTLGIFNTVISAIVAVLNGFAVIALLAASFGIVNTLLMSVQERTKEIGLMKAMGMRSSRIFLLFSSEAVLIGFWGSVIGVVVAIVVGQVVNTILAGTLLTNLPGLNLLEFTPMAIIGTIVLIMAIAFLAGTLPARKASKQNPIDALRYE